ncbi:hypothetical protein D9613_001010 [Agrocybe pediades]|uniref:Uncharacterized protein n=1 Tax=Agrocybe pediades TaxID=84607 RepID=A0A8H4QZW6_9AGAR|nr:hypothetical protein D9613_001010 [Agrocybe pediades]
MRPFITLALSFAALPLAFANPEPQAEIVGPTPCLAVCRPTKPVCAAGYAATGSEGCWGCCQPVCRRICPIVDPVENSAVIGIPPPSPPLCLSQETLVAADSVTGCWGCCIPACGSVCALKKPTSCPVGQAVFGTKGCWSCCDVIRIIDPAV